MAVELGRLAQDSICWLDSAARHRMIRTTLDTTLHSATVMEHSTPNKDGRKKGKQADKSIN
jgi:hypothetical protein